MRASSAKALSIADVKMIVIVFPSRPLFYPRLIEIFYGGAALAAGPFSVPDLKFAADIRGMCPRHRTNRGSGAG